MTSPLNRCRAALALAAACALCSTAAPAAVVTFTTQANFAQALAVTSIDSFDDLTPAQSVMGAIRASGPGSYTATVNDTTNAGAANGGNDLFTVDSGGGNIWLSTAVAGNELLFGGFDASVRGIGGSIFGTDVDGAFSSGQSFRLTLTDVLGASTTFDLDNVTASNGFVGFVSTEAIAWLSVLALQPAGANPGNPYSYSYATVDNLVIGQAATVPEPASLALAGAALLLAAGASRRQRA